MRFLATRYIPKGSIKVSQKDGLAVAYIYTTAAGRLAAIAFIGKANKPAWHFNFKTEAQREAKVRSLFESVKSHAERRAARRKESNGGHTFIVGDIVTNSWGYDQTNVNWYRVVRVSRVFVWLQPICGHTKETGFMSGSSMPYADTSNADPSTWSTVDKKDPAEKHKAEGGRVVMRHGSGSKWNGKPLYESWYA